METAVDIGVGAYNLGYEIGNVIKTGDTRKLEEMPIQMLEGIKKNICSFFALLFLSSESTKRECKRCNLSFVPSF